MEQVGALGEFTPAEFEAIHNAELAAQLNKSRELTPRS